MPAFKTGYEQKKWQAIKNVASEPLEKVLRGNYTRKDIETLGTALKQYDELASSLFDEGLRTASIKAKRNADALAEELTGATAAQLAKLYSQELDRQYKEMMPQLAQTIREVLNMSNQPMVNQAPSGIQKFQNNGMPAANELFEGSSLQKSLQLVNKQLGDQSTQLTDIELLAQKFGEAANDPTSPTTPSKPSKAKVNPQSKNSGWLHGLAAYLDAREELRERKQKIKARKKKRQVLGFQRDKGIGKFLTTAQNTKKEAGKITAMLKEKYSRLGRFIPSKDNLGKLLMAAFLIPTMLKSAVTSFMDGFDIGAFARQTFDTSIDWMWEKIKSFLGLDKTEDQRKQERQVITDKANSNLNQSNQSRYAASSAASPYRTKEVAEFYKKQGIDTPESHIVADQKTADALNKAAPSAPSKSTASPNPPAGGDSSGLTANTNMAVGSAPAGQSAVPKVMGTVAGSGNTPAATTAKGPQQLTMSGAPPVVAKPKEVPKTEQTIVTGQGGNLPTGNRPLGIATIPTMSGVKDDLALMNLGLLTK